jgi:putative acetyltransferase
MNAILKTERLILRTITTDDANDIFEYSKHPDVGPNAGWKPHDTVEETIVIMDLLFLYKPLIFGMVHAETGKLFGTIGLVVDPKRANPAVKMLGYMLVQRIFGVKVMSRSCKSRCELTLLVCPILILSRLIASPIMQLRAEF